MTKKLEVVFFLESINNPEYLIKVLNNGGLDFTCQRGSTLPEIIQLVKDRSPAILLVDLNFPPSITEALLAELGQIQERIPVILLASIASEDVALQLMEKGAADYILTEHPKRLPIAVKNAVETFNSQKLVSFSGRESPEPLWQELQDKEKKLLTTQKLARLGYWKMNLNDKSLYWTEATYKVWGVDKATFDPTLENIRSLVHPEDWVPFYNTYTAETPGQVEFRIVLPDNTIKWLHSQGELVRDKEGKAISFEGTIQDITEQKSAYQQLVVSEARHRGIVQSQTNYIIRTDLAGRYSYYNNKFLQDFGWLYSGKEIIGKDAMSSVKEYHHQRVNETAEKCLANPGKVFQVEIDKPLPTGGIKSTLWEFTGITDFNGNPIEIQCMGIDISERIHAEQLLKEQLTRHEFVLKATSDAIYDWDLVSGDIFWGEGFESLFGYKVNKITENIDFWASNLHPEESHKILANLQRFLQGKENRWEEGYRFKKADGKYAYVVEKGFLIRDDTARAIRMVGALRDVTENKKLEDLFNTASKLARIGSYEIDLVQESLYWSDITKEIHEVNLDFKPSVETALNFYKAGENREQITQALQKIAKDGDSFALELQLVTAKGNERWVRVIAEAEFLHSQCIRIVGSFQDIDSRKKAQLALREAYEEKNAVLESIDDAFFTVDTNWVVTYWNNKAEKVLGRQRQEVLYRNLWELYTDAVNLPFYTYYHKAVTENTAQHFVAFYDTLNKWIEVSAYPGPKGLSVYFKDVTERKSQEIQLLELNKSLQNYTEELVASNKGLEQFSYIVSHNLRAPVANIKGIMNLLEDDNYPPDIKATFHKGLLLNAERLDNVINDLNTILRVKTDIGEQKDLINLDVLVADILESIQNLVIQEKVQVNTDFTAVPELISIRSYCQSIFYNLIINSIKYRRPGISPIIQISNKIEGDKLKISFKDNGLGIDLTKKKDQVFSLYKRFHHHIEGKGMGLFMVKAQVEALGGTISVQSQVNKGTEFILEFNHNPNYA